MTWTAPLRHPLLIALPLFIIVLATGFGDTARLFLLEPVALAAGSPAEPTLDSVPEDERAAFELRQLKDEVAKLTLANTMLREGSAQLKDLEDAAQRPLAGVITAAITVRGTAANMRRSVYISAGTRQGVKPGYPVTVGRTLIGVVAVCTPNGSLVHLITDPDARVPVTILPRDGAKLAAELKAPVKRTTDSGKLLLNEEPDAPAARIAAAKPGEAAPMSIRGMLRGDSSASPRVGSLPVDDVDINSKISKGMLVVTNESSGAFPAGLLVGEVDEVSTRNTFLSVKMKPSADIEDASVVLVIPHERPTLDELSRRLAPRIHLDGAEAAK